MSNPYQPPMPTSSTPNALSEVRYPAIALIAVSVIALIFGFMGFVIDAVLVATGTIDHLEAINEGPISEYTQITVRTIWGVILVMASSFVFFGALKMKKLENYSLAKSAALVAMIPCLGPCCLLGIPFGIWAFITLNKPYIRQSFT